MVGTLCTLTLAPVITPTVVNAAEYTKYADRTSITAEEVLTKEQLEQEISYIFKNLVIEVTLGVERLDIDGLRARYGQSKYFDEAESEYRVRNAGLDCSIRVILEDLGYMVGEGVINTVNEKIIQKGTEEAAKLLLKSVSTITTLGYAVMLIVKIQTQCGHLLPHYRYDPGCSIYPGHSGQGCH